ncbi:hypothetical protein KHQ08_15745 [Pseudochrobactrum algeriensis]|uniref:Uncharacterized protein n=1 Tax=Pseudochrobactrum saccharolyticum TaxID=354352 RepID=A0A7W8AM81_9HYPH|nr:MULTISPECIES: hypothetical protein [Pseudochrobactrum]MBX8785431.1 hypothetical protein [Ochrobactrum sp. GRS2]MBX8814370.1 hypothetical protein [Ochrobactrum sp. MR34]KAB0536648.1 hypothetical protein F7P81_16890 [Pseudochrobactrum saccharolyticum]MBB5092855.1 hypothetical protein [Pseudochrobactrum saccharolyticum]QVQ36547.1 hypothetical protein KHQ08_15745 [Pseudochrobactrum algeriensis]
MKRLLAFAAVSALALAGALPASAQTVEWGGGFAGQTMGNSAVSGGGFLGAGSTAQGYGTTNGWATTTGIGGGVVVPGFGIGASGSLYSSGISGQSGAVANSSTGFLGGSSAASATGGAMGSASGFVSINP